MSSAQPALPHRRAAAVARTCWWRRHGSRGGSADVGRVAQNRVADDEGQRDRRTGQHRGDDGLLQGQSAAVTTAVARLEGRGARTGQDGDDSEVGPVSYT